MNLKKKKKSTNEPIYKTETESQIQIQSQLMKHFTNPQVIK